MATCQDVEMRLFSGTQTSVGEPAHGSDMASHMFSNTTWGVIRNLFVLFENFCMMGTSNGAGLLSLDEGSAPRDLALVDVVSYICTAYYSDVAELL
jgi:hypothetical protein